MLLNILVTGAAGLIGGEVCSRLIARGHAVHGLVHRRKDVLSNDGTQVALTSILSGDVTKEGLGLKKDAFPTGFDLVIHCAASLEFDAPQAKLDAINVEGTGNVVHFSRTHNAALLHVSTAYVCGENNGVITEDPVASDTKFGNYYESSKASGEAMVQASGIPYLIARPAVVMGDSVTGKIREFPSICNLFRLLARGSISLLPTTQGASFDLVPIDYVAGGIATLAEHLADDKNDASGSIFHLNSPNPTPVKNLAKALGGFAHFPQARVVNFDSYFPDMLPSSQVRVMEKMLATFGTYLQRDPRFDDANFRAITGLTCPPTGEAYLLRLISYAIEAGYLPAAGKTQSPSASASEHAGNACPA